MFTEPLLTVIDGPVAASAGVSVPAAVSTAAVTVAVTAASRRPNPALLIFPPFRDPVPGRRRRGSGWPRCRNRAAELRMLWRNAIDDSFFAVTGPHRRGSPGRGVNGRWRPIPSPPFPAADSGYEQRAPRRTTCRRYAWGQHQHPAA